MSAAQPLLALWTTSTLGLISSPAWETCCICSRLLDSALRLAVYPCIWGSSGMVWRYLSRALLNTSLEQFLMSLIDLGRELNRRGPLTLSEASLSFCMWVGQFVSMGGMTQRLPRRESVSLLSLEPGFSWMNPLDPWVLMLGT